VPTMMHWARAQTPGPGFAWGLPKDLVPSMFECADGVWIHLMRCADTQSPLMARLLAEMGEEGVAQANALVNTSVTPGYPNYGANCEAFMRRPSADWLADFWANDIPAQPSAPYGAILSDAQARANGYAIEVDDRELGRVVEAGTPFGTEPPSRVRGPVPCPGEHTAEILGALPGSASAAGRPTVPTGGRRGPDAPLAGVKVLDFGNFLAGPLGPMLLADLGADVVKVEALTGDPMRRVERVFAACQRGKRAVALDLKSPGSRPILEALVGWADVVHHNLRMPAARRLGLDYESLAAIRPNLVYCHASSYGPRGERADWPGYDQLFQAAAGWEVLGAGQGNPPMWFRFGFMDHLCAMASTVATLLALYHRDRTGQGQMVTGSLLGGAALTNSETVVRDGELAELPELLDARQTGLSPGYRLYQVADGWIALAARDEFELASVCRAFGAAVPADLEAALARRPSGEVLSELAARDVACTEVRMNQGEAFLDDPANRACGLVAAYPHAEWGTTEQVGALWDLGDLDLRLDRAPPVLGQHTVEVLVECGLTDADIGAAAAAGIVVQA